jgi:CRP/FNR family cyclic AMP-dependent transcriptional regulator
MARRLTSAARRPFVLEISRPRRVGRRQREQQIWSRRRSPHIMGRDFGVRQLRGLAPNPVDGDMSWVEGIGYVASLLVFSTFYMKTMIPLRWVAIASNVAFIAYGFLGHLYPVLILHLLLLPLNAMRLRQLHYLIRDIRNASEDGFSFEAMTPFMTRQTFRAGHGLFKLGDRADKLYLVRKGSIRLPEIEVTVGEGAMLGEIGLFSPHQQRTTSAKCETEVEVLTLTQDKVVELYYQNPAFGFYLVRLVIRRLLENWSGKPSRRSG